eukprot:SM000331S12523  [mRNA]  locus=s331:27091:34038:- [translate_table: standard]
MAGGGQDEAMDVHGSPSQNRGDDVAVDMIQAAASPEPMEVALAAGHEEAVLSAGIHSCGGADDSLTGNFRWSIESFSRITGQKRYLDVFVVGSYKRLLIFPKGWGNNTDHLSIYLNVAQASMLPHGWTRFAQFKLGVVNQLDPKLAIKREADTPSTSIPLALQSLFYKLQYSHTSIAIKDLTKSFGWNSSYSFMQRDVQEMSRALREKLEDKLKGTAKEGTIQKLFEGHHMHYIDCINVDYKSTRKESFYDLQLDARGCRDVYESFDKYVTVEKLEGGNKYHVGQCGLQDARKGVTFIDFPPVLLLHLKNFDYGYLRCKKFKIQDPYGLTRELNLDREDGKYLSPDADRSVRNLFTLHRIMFDNERVNIEDGKRALDEQNGGQLPQRNPGYNQALFKYANDSSSYMLVYIRKSDKNTVMCTVDERDIAEHLQIRMKKEQEEKERKRREKAEANLYTVMKLARDEDLREQIGQGRYFDLVDFDKDDVAKELGIPVQCQRYWLWAKRQNRTSRPNRPLTPVEEAQAVDSLKKAANKTHTAELKLFLETPIACPETPITTALPERANDEILLFLKFYDPLKEELRYVGRMFVRLGSKPMDIESKLASMAGIPPTEELLLYEEISSDGPSVMCESIDKKVIFKSSQLEDGDTVCIQRPPAATLAEAEQPIRYPDQPKPQPVKYRGVQRLSDMLVHYNQTSDILYFEILDLPLPELQGLKSLEVAFHNSKTKEGSVHNICLPKQFRVGDLIAELRTKIFPHTEKIDNINDQHLTLRAEEVPDEERDIGPNDRLIHVMHFTRDATQYHVLHHFGEPLFLVAHENETTAEIRDRIKAKLRVPDKEFAKWKLAFCQLGYPEYLLDTDVVVTRFQINEAHWGWEHYLGIEHADTTSKHSH